ncbi:4Fe-4S ferredoxin, iron-sulfur binding domain protein [Metallosphaera sedula]|uniref:4Fe-4S ferredoxin, iron-sulfur binding domain protein n=3 Tax=Metallosphaera TaxID=41980 RepID=A4YE92_METS5|nr:MULTISPECIES: 4Fe-4S binding protein [Metallosphaera]ABP94744.1 4Fe-4S ferredoxin, iron-sulfur binding domain protein [Metallosphaera sedula DSM 5348]AIM26731.1 4Fe-4S ferredoxin, iron-sulfur binding domain protein [Metallosphaera sedula]AKV73687.1 4Fe-4S ferredoxin [Metallosphaera sedula]AKV75927.1 4Fe-4S ferredoxin [Metallosphaera sedula]AKV78178.1 4Fe-4S ferredoxin [Metallosphaera sedula]
MDYLPIFLAVASLMTAFSIYLIYLVKKGINGIGFLLVLYLSGSMVVMFASLSVFFSSPNQTTEALALASNSAYMIFGLIPILFSINKKPNARRWYTVLLFAVSMAVSEALMGETFDSILTKQLGNPLLGVQSYWYYGVMISEMVFTLVYSLKGMDRTLRNYLIVALPIMGISPMIFPSNPTFVTDATWLNASLMIVATILIYETLYRDRLKRTQETMTSLEMMLVFTLMMAGLFTYYLTGSWYVFDFSMLAGMSWFIYRAIEGPSHLKGNYLRDATWTFSFILVTFIMEWFMGGVLDFVTGTFSTGISGFISSLPLGFVSPTRDFGLGALFNFLSIFGAVTGSIWFLIMMGTEMGMLAVFRIGQVKLRENKIRLALMVSAYAIYTIYLPSFSPLASKIPYIPYMWSMGLGTLGPVSSHYLIPGIVGTYVVSAILSFLFGSRQICSVTCTAPTMYQGTFYDSLKSFNRTSKLGRKTLGSRLRPWYKVIALTVWASLLAFAVVSFLDQKGLLNFTIFGNDPTVFLYSFYFNFLWYVVFISIPFMGTYACATQGWCSWGTFNQFFGGLGLFKLKVKDPDLCVKCETKACAEACPVGNTDLPGNFIRSGQFKSMRCIGVGDCAEACPYNNISFYDIRSWLKEKLK